MSEELKNKLFNLEVPPPRAVWDDIATELNSGIQGAWVNRLQSLETPPPVSAWPNIVANLDLPSGNIRNALHDYEATPPAGAWQHIVNEIAPGQTSPRKGTVVALGKLLAAACIAGLLILAGVRLLSHGKKPDVAGTTVRPPVETNKGTLPAHSLPSADTTQVAVNESTARVTPRSASARYLAANEYRLQSSPESVVPIMSPSAEDTEPGEPFHQASLAMNGNVPGNCTVIAESDPYLNFINPEGYLIRISKKLAETLGCLRTSGNQVSQEPCEQQIAAWRDKLAKTTPVASTGGFMDVLYMVQSDN